MTAEHACVVCQHNDRIPYRPPVCDACRKRIQSQLREIPDLYARLDPTPTRRRGEKVTRTPEDPAPLNLDVLDLLAEARPGSVAVKMAGEWSHVPGGDKHQIGHLSVATRLDQWVRDWISCDWCPGDRLPDPYVATLVGWLDARLDLACDRHPAIDEFAAEIRRIHSTLRRYVGELNASGEKIGRCPAVRRDGARCNAVLRADPYVSRIACDRCGTSWRSWLELAAAMQDNGIEGSEAA